jgi:hypothetical protein
VEAARRAIQDSLDRRALPARLERAHLNGIFVVRHVIPTPARVSVIVSGEGSRWTRVLSASDVSVRDVCLLDQASPGEIVVDGQRVPVRQTIDELEGEYLVWLDASSFPVHKTSVTALLEPLRVEDVAMTGGLTRHASRRVVLQAGLVVKEDGVHYAYPGLSVLPQPNFYLNLTSLPREVSAVSVAASAMRRDRWEEMHGWTPELPPALAHADLGLRALEKGYRVVQTPLALFDRADDLPSLPAIKGRRWGWGGYRDPFWSPHLSVESEDGLPYRSGDPAPRVLRGGTAFRIAAHG